jgi:hypothetical protein
MRRFLLSAVLLLCLAPAARAQVGHPPESSPYHDLAKGHTAIPLYGHLYGGGGDLKIGPHDGQSYGLRYNVRLSNPIAFSFAVERAETIRYIVNPFVKLANRVSGPVDQALVLAEGGIEFSVTGQKSWHRLAPYLGFGAGGAFSESVPADTSRYDFGNKIYLQPRGGVRVFFTPSLHLRGEAGLALWKLSYPSTFAVEPVEEPGTAEHPNAVLPPPAKLSEWTASPWIQIGLGYTFNW